jgi:hypothetical protein
MPGIGGVFFGCGVFLFGSGMPGIFPAGILFALASFGFVMPGILPLTGTGLVEKPGGRFAGSRLTTFPTLAFVLIAVSVVEQARLAALVKQIRTKNKFFHIKSEPLKSMNFKIAVPV